uniref:Ig-like domain-containing protein n=1 Tax=Varanus komodoensis TaxID=61221 RepID=A0A8D2LK60_VARKO
ILAIKMTFKKKGLRLAPKNKSQHPDLDKPSLIMTSSGQNSPGGNVTLKCQGPEEGLAFALLKSGSQIAFQAAEARRDTAEFLLWMLSLKDAASYTCQYHHTSNSFVWSEPSSPVELDFRGEAPKYPKPTISVSPSEVVALGGHVTVHCKSQGYAGMEFSLCKEGSASVDCRSTKVAAVEEVAFSIVDAQQSDGGTYRCIYHSKSDEGPWWSDYSDEPNILVSSEEVPVGGNLKISCRNEEHRYAVFSLIKEGAPDVLQTLRADRDGAIFPITAAKESDGGIYCTDSGTFPPSSWSFPRLLLDPGLPRPSIQVRPSGQPALSMNVTIECQGPEKGLHFILLKSRERKASQWAEEDRSTAEFPLSLMSPEDAGTYACQYHRKGKRFLLSEPSDPVELRLRGERLALLSSHQPRPPERGVQPVWSYLWVPLQGLGFLLFEEEALGKVISPLLGNGAVKLAGCCSRSCSQQLPCPLPVHWTDCQRHCRHRGFLPSPNRSLSSPGETGEQGVAHGSEQPPGLLLCALTLLSRTFAAGLSSETSIRLGVAALVLLVLLLIVAEAGCRCRKGQL